MSSGSILHSQPQLCQPAHHPEPESETVCYFCLSHPVCPPIHLSHLVCMILSAGRSWTHLLPPGVLTTEFCFSADGPEHHCGVRGTKPGCLHCETCLLLKRLTAAITSCVGVIVSMVHHKIWIRASLSCLYRTKLSTCVWWKSKEPRST